jgi:hypothetical protein
VAFFMRIAERKRLCVRIHLYGLAILRCRAERELQRFP